MPPRNAFIEEDERYSRERKPKKFQAGKGLKCTSLLAQMWGPMCKDRQGSGGATGKPQLAASKNILILQPQGTGLCQQSERFFFFKFIGVELIYNVVFVSGVTLKDLRSGFFPRSSR